MSHRVLFLDHHPGLGGGERSLLDLLGALRGVDAAVALPGPGPLAERVQALGIAVHFVRFDPRLLGITRLDSPLALLPKLGALFHGARSTAVLLRRLRPDILHTNSMKAHMVGALAARSHRVAIVGHVRDIIGAGPNRRLFRSLSCRTRIHLVAISEAVRSAMFSGISGVRVIHNGIPDLPEPPASRERSGPATVGMLAQLARWKGQEVFVRAAGYLASRHPDCRFELAGGIMFPRFPGNRGYLRELKALSGSLGLDGRLVFRGPVGDPAEFCASIDVMVHASIEPEPFGRVLLEGMRSAIPVVAPDWEAVREIVGDGIHALLYPPGDARALADRLEALLVEPDLGRRIGRSGRERFLQHFTIERTARSVEEMYREILG